MPILAGNKHPKVCAYTIFQRIEYELLPPEVDIKILSRALTI